MAVKADDSSPIRSSPADDVVGAVDWVVPAVTDVAVLGEEETGVCCNTGKH